MKTYELSPVLGQQESFYGKAHVQEYDDGSAVLFSYYTPIIRREKNGSLSRLWAGWSATTGRHIYAFCGLRKKDFTALPVDRRYDGMNKAAAYSGTLVF